MTYKKIFSDKVKIEPAYMKGIQKYGSLFISFIAEVDRFIKLAKSAPSMLVEKAIKDNELTPSLLDRWNLMISEIEKSRNELEITFQLDVSGENEAVINKELSFFRSLWRWLEEIHCSWSKNYESINETLGKMHDLRIDIDRKYHLGQHRINKPGDTERHYN